jgi:hypothetical protein
MMVMQEGTPTDRDEGFRGGWYARTEGELCEKAIALLEKCRIEPGRSGQEIPELESVS